MCIVMIIHVHVHVHVAAHLDMREDVKGLLDSVGVGGTNDEYLGL